MNRRDLGAGLVVVMVAGALSVGAVPATSHAVPPVARDAGVIVE
jgi:hypothetical protein